MNRKLKFYLSILVVATTSVFAIGCSSDSSTDSATVEQFLLTVANQSATSTGWATMSFDSEGSSFQIDSITGATYSVTAELVSSDKNNSSTTAVYKATESNSKMYPIDAEFTLKDLTSTGYNIGSRAFEFDE